MAHLSDFVNLAAHPIDDVAYIADKKAQLDRDGVVCLHDFIAKDGLQKMIDAAMHSQHLAYFTNSTHNVYLTPPDTSLPETHIFNRQITSSKGCITTDQVPDDSGLPLIYHDEKFQNFIAQIVAEQAIYPYADPLSAINIHYASEGQELGWHFDNSSFAVTLLLQAPEAGGIFEYCRDLRDADRGEMNFEGVEAVIDGTVTPQICDIPPGTLVLFRGRNSMHRVTPTIGNRTRFLVVFAYNNAPDIALSETARMTFYGRLGTE